MEDREAVNIGELTEAVNDKMDRDMNNRASNVITLINTYTNGYSGYNIWSNGYCEQWGLFTIATSGQGTITFLKRFNGTNYTFLMQKLSSDASTWNVMERAGSRNVNSIGIQSNLTGYTLSGSWRTSGYLAEGEY